MYRSGFWGAEAVNKTIKKINFYYLVKLKARAFIVIILTLHSYTIRTVLRHYIYMVDQGLFS